MNWTAWLCVVMVAQSPTSAVDFDAQIVPVLTKSGCNAGACHGAAAGRGGFRLSLLGSDPAADYSAIVLALEGRRIDQADPENSLVYAKPTGRMEHGGDVPLDPAGPGAARLRDWIRAGAPRGRPRILRQLEVTPADFVAPEYPTEVQLQARATFEDGQTEDVTLWTLWSVDDADAAEIEQGSGRLRLLQPGQHVVVARFLDRVVPLRIVVPRRGQLAAVEEPPVASYVDEEISRTLRVLRIQPEPAVDSAALVRRVTLDLTGRLPEPEVIEQFVHDSRPDRFDRLVDRLLASAAWVDYWTLRFARILRLHALPNEPQALQAYASWLRDQLASGEPWDKFAHTLLTATGDSHSVGPANFSRMASDPRAQAELVSQALMGVRLACANCHNHPLDRWTQDDYHGLAAAFARLQRGRIVEVAPRGAVTHARTGQPAVARIPGERFLSEQTDPRIEVADWLTAGQNRYLAAALVNRLWHAVMGRGLVEPIDDFRETNPPTHPQLLQRLTEEFRQHAWDVRWILRQLVLSQTYARSSPRHSDGLAKRFYASSNTKPVLPEVFLDAIADATGVPPDISPELSGKRYVNVLDLFAPVSELNLLGRCQRLNDCESSVVQTGMLAAQLHMLNGGLINAKLADSRSHYQRGLITGQSDTEIIRDMFLRTLARELDQTEVEFWQQRVSAPSLKERQEKLADLIWSLLASPAFASSN